MCVCVWWGRGEVRVRGKNGNVTWGRCQVVWVKGREGKGSGVSRDI